jgi:alpha-1,2-mannosyltransferase
VARALPRRLGPVAVVWPLLTALALASKPLQSNLRFGQVSVFLTLAVLADVVALDGHRWQGVPTGLAAAIKLTPLLFIPYLWLTGRRRAAALAPGTVAGATAIGLAVFPHDSAAFWGSYLWHESHGLPLAEGGNQSIYAVLLRAGAHGAALGVLWVALGAGVVVLGLWRARSAWLGGQRLFSLAVVGCVSILVSPISWTHHQFWILLAAAGVFTANASVDLLIAALIILLMVIGLPGIQVVGAFGRWLAVNHRAALAAVVACALPFVAIRRQRLSG